MKLIIYKIIYFVIMVLAGGSGGAGITSGLLGIFEDDAYFKACAILLQISIVLLVLAYIVMCKIVDLEVEKTWKKIKEGMKKREVKTNG